MNLWQWIVETLRAYPELALFLALAVGFWIGPKKLEAMRAQVTT